MTKIIALCGKKQSGKTTLSNFLHGHEMKRHDIIERFLISPQGELVVNCTFHDENGKEFEELGVLDLQQHTDEFFQYASRRIWPLIRGYNFADSLKEICVMLFNIPPECVYGTDEQKNQLQEHLLWENMPGVISQEQAAYLFDRFESFSHNDAISTDERAAFERSRPTKSGEEFMCFSPHSFSVKNKCWIGYSEVGIFVKDKGPMTAREFMQYLGTDVMRKMYQPIWLENCFRRIEADKPEIAVIGDCRFLNEIEAVQKRGGKVIRLSRSLYESAHQSEIDADMYEGFDGFVDTANLDIEQSCDAFLSELIKLGVTQKIKSVGKFTASIKD